MVAQIRAIDRYLLKNNAIFSAWIAPFEKANGMKFPTASPLVRKAPEKLVQALNNRADVVRQWYWQCKDGNEKRFIKSEAEAMESVWQTGIDTAEAAGEEPPSLSTALEDRLDTGMARFEQLN